MTIARTVMERIFILIQFFSYLRKQGRLFTLGALEWIFDPKWGNGFSNLICIFILLLFSS